MAVNLLAICKPAGHFILKRVTITRPLQEALEGVFTEQEARFFQGIDSEVDFDGSWKPEDSELLRSPLTPEIVHLWSQSTRNVVSLDALDAENILGEAVKGLGVVLEDGGARRLLIQQFTARQVLGRDKLAFIFNNDTFTRLTAPVFTLSTKVSAVVNDQFLKFRSFSNVKMIFDLNDFYKEATDAQIDAFSTHTSLFIPNASDFKGIADQTIRKLVTAITKKRVLEMFSSDQIARAASGVGLPVNLNGGRIVMPNNKADAKKLMHFLDEGFYRGPLTGISFVANSKRQA